MKTYRVESAVAVDGHCLSIRWTDGLEGVVNLADLLDRKGPYEALRDPERFRDVRIEEYGHTIYWLDENGSEIDICPDVLRARLDPEVAEWIAEQERRWASQHAAE